MEYNAFKNKVLLGIQDFMGEGVRVECSSVMKNNGITLDGVIILEDVIKVSPTIYINEFYEEYKKGKPISAIVYQIITMYEKNKVNKNVNFDFFNDFNQVKKMIVYKLVNFEKNKNLLQSVPHIKILDLAIIFYCVVMNDSLQNGTILIYDNHCKLWETDVDELYEIAKENAPKLLPFEFRNMETIIREMFTDNLFKEFKMSVAKNLEEEVSFEITDEWIEEVAYQMMDTIKGNKEERPMYVLSNRSKTLGACCILYEGVLKQIAEELKADLFILPSSIHEVIIIPVRDYIGESQLRTMVEDVNESQVLEEEVLSDEVYYYSKDKDRICLNEFHGIKKMY